MDNQSLAHSRYNCTYHIVFMPKYRRKVMFGDLRKEVGEAIIKDLFLEEKGLFPEPKEICFSCSCPDWALMCKHVAAVLYGIGARFDEDPLLFFELREIDVGRFIDVTLKNRVESMLANADKPSERILQAMAGENGLG